MRALTKLLAVLLASSLAVSAQSNQPDLTKDPTLYVVAYAHLDTQWRWEYPRVINEYIPKTLHDNFALKTSIRTTSSTSAARIGIA